MSAPDSRSRTLSIAAFAAGTLLLAALEAKTGLLRATPGDGPVAQAAVTPPPAPPAARELRVCSDPNNLPFSNDRLEGFENRIAELVARDLGATLSYTWWAQRRGFIRNTLKAGKCDVVLGLPRHAEMALTTRPYYRSGYVFVTPKARGLELRSLDDPRLRTLRIGVQTVGDDYANTPPVHALSRRGVVDNLVGYSVLGDYGREAPLAGVVDAVSNGEVDLAIVWGPLGGWLAKQRGGSLEITPVPPEVDGAVPIDFEISMGVRRGETRLKEELEQVLNRRQAEVDTILDEYGIPRL